MVECCSIENREKAVVYALLGLSAGIITLLAAALALLYYRCRSAGGDTTASSHRNRKHYSAVSTSEPEVTSSISSQPSPTSASVSNNWPQAIRRTDSDVLLHNGRGTVILNDLHTKVKSRSRASLLMKIEETRLPYDQRRHHPFFGFLLP